MAAKTAAADNNNSDRREALLNKLSSLLGFDDGADDLLYHILSINSEKEIVDYLAQLLGSSTSELGLFAENVGRYRSGEELSVPVDSTNDNSKDAAVAVPKKELDYSVASVKPKATASGQASLKDKKTATAKIAKSTAKTTGKPKAVAKKATPPAPPSQQATKNATVDHTSGITKTSVAVDSKTKVSSQDEPKKEQAKQPKSAAATATAAKKEVLKGTPSVVCGCFGLSHKAVGNCLYCGRISCEREGLDFCAFCGHLVDAPIRPDDDDEDAMKAWTRKEQILDNQRKSVQRTLVLDDQADYHTSSASAWSTEEERRKDGEARQRLEQSRRKQAINLAI